MKSINTIKKEIICRQADMEMIFREMKESVNDLKEFNKLNNEFNRNKGFIDGLQWVMETRKPKETE